MSDAVAEAIRKTLEGGAGGVVFLVDDDKGVIPYMANDPTDERIDRVYLGDNRYTMPSFAVLAADVQKDRIGVVMRECDRRMMAELAKHNKIDMEKIDQILISCTQELANACGCDHPAPENAVLKNDVKAGEPVLPTDGEIENADEKLAFWMEHFERCVKCYGCRNVCPLCFCEDCAIEDESFVKVNSFPPEIPIFHLIRAVDMADRCIDCGVCESACPVDIPLRQLYRKAREIMIEAFNYEAGVSEEKSPLELLGEESDLGGMDHGYRSF